MWFGAAGLMTCAPLAAASAGPQDAPPAVRSGPTDLLKLNEAIAAYLEGDVAGSRELLVGLVASEPDNSAALYYLGLVELRMGLGAVREGRGAEAQTSFDAARQNFERIFQLDPKVRPIEAALHLGIAQLAAETPEESVRSPEFARRSRNAVNTLSEYAADPQGRQDRFAHFFLGVARWRLSLADQTQDLGLAERSLEEALRAAKEQLTDEAELARFETRVLYYLGLLDLTRGKFSSAKLRLGPVAEREPGSDLGVNAAALLKLVEERQDTESRPIELPVPKPFGPLALEGSFRVGALYDTNVILLGKDTLPPRGIHNEDDFRFGFEASFDISRSWTKADNILGESFVLGAGGETSHYWHESISEFDVNSYGGRVYVNWEIVKDFFAGLQYDYSFNQLGHKPFISSHRITPVLSKIWRVGREERARTDLYYVLDLRDYRDPSTRDWLFDRDGNYHQIGVLQRFNLWRAKDLWSGYYAQAPARESKDGDRWMQVLVGYSFRNESTQGREFDLTSHGVSAGVEVPLPLRLAFDFTAMFSWDDYWGRSAFDFVGKERFDFVQRYSFGLTYTLIGKGEMSRMPTLEAKLRGGIDWHLHNSNIETRLGEDIYEFDRTMYGVLLSVTF